MRPTIFLALFWLIFLCLLLYCVFFLTSPPCCYLILFIVVFLLLISFIIVCCCLVIIYCHLPLLSFLCSCLLSPYVAHLHLVLLPSPFVVHCHFMLFFIALKCYHCLLTPNHHLVELLLTHTIIVTL
jgi:hypothetical protein